MWFRLWQLPALLLNFVAFSQLPLWSFSIDDVPLEYFFFSSSDRSVAFLIRSLVSRLMALPTCMRVSFLVAFFSTGFYFFFGQILLLPTLVVLSRDLAPDFTDQEDGNSRLTRLVPYPSVRHFQPWTFFPFSAAEDACDLSACFHPI